MSSTVRTEKPAGSAMDAEPQQGHDFIRPYTRDDRNAVEQLVSQGFMEGLPKANKKLYLSPGIIFFVIFAGSVLDLIFGVHKVPVTSPLHYVQYLIGPCLVLLPTLAGIEYLQRPFFENRLRHIIGGKDMATLDEYYAADVNAMSGAWVFEHKDTVVGVVMLDARQAGKALGSVFQEKTEGQLGLRPGELQAEPGWEVLFPTKEPSADAGTSTGVGADDAQGLRNRKAKPAPTTSEASKPAISTLATGTVAEIRHLDVIAPYRRHGVGTELLGAALDTAFGLTPGDNENSDAGRQATVTRVIALTSPFTAGEERVWAKMGFTRVSPEDLRGTGWRKDRGVGMGKWKGVWVSVDREGWLEAREGLYSRFAPQEGLEQGEGRDVAPDGSIIEKKDE